MLGISEFLLASKKSCVFSVIFKVVDDMENIGKYNWGTLVYEYLVFSLCSASLALQNEPSRFEFYVVGCAYLLDVFIDPRASVMSVEKDDGAQQSNMYDRMKARPRMRFKSVATKTPYSVYGKKKLKSMQIG